MLKKDKLIIRKTDDELVRYIKQNTLISERKRYEDLMKDEAERRKLGLSNEEKKALYF
jgi:hypothetical protein